MYGDHIMAHPVGLDLSDSPIGDGHLASFCERNENYREEIFDGECFR